MRLVPSLRSRAIERAPRSWAIEHVPRTWALWAAARPSQVLLILAVYALGVGAATAGPPVVTAVPPSAAIGPTVITTGSVTVGAVALVPVATAIHYANEYVDADTDALADRTPFSGGSGALSATGLPASFLGGATALATLVALATLTGIVLREALPSASIALLSVILVAGLTYSLPPLALIRRGVGEIVNAALGGILLPLYGMSVLGAPTATGVLVVLPFTLVVGCNLLATHWADRRADAAVGKQTLAVRWSARGIRRTYAILVVVAAALTAALWWAGAIPYAVAAAHLVAVPFLGWGWLTLARRESPFPPVVAMILLAVASTAAWWWVGIAA